MSETREFLEQRQAQLMQELNGLYEQVKPREHELAEIKYVLARLQDPRTKEPSCQ